MKGMFLPIAGLLWLCPVSLVASDLGGVSAKFTPDEVMPGDLVTLMVQMERDDYGEFDLNVPSHPQLHLVTRELIPPTHTDGRYTQSERLMLQALSSGTLTLTGMTIQLTESTGIRTVELPDLTLTVNPFETADEVADPEPFPKPEKPSKMGPSLTPALIAVIAVIAVGFILVLLIRLKLASKPIPEAEEITGRNFDTILRAATITTESLEAILNDKGASLSSGLRSDLETFLYSPDSSAEERDELHARLRKELGR